MYPDHDQFNSIHEKLQDAFAAVKAPLSPFQPFYFTCVREHEEDFVTVEYLRDVAVQSGLDGRHIFIEDIGFDAEKKYFCDLGNSPIDYAFKLYPWEWLLADEFGENVMAGGIRFFEPPWKMILANKGILPILWRWRRATGICCRPFSRQAGFPATTCGSRSFRARGPT